MRWPCICTMALQAGLYASAPLLAPRVQPVLFAWMIGDRGLFSYLSLSLSPTQRLEDQKYCIYRIIVPTLTRHKRESRTKKNP